MKKFSLAFLASLFLGFAAPVFADGDETGGGICKTFSCTDGMMTGPAMTVEEEAATTEEEETLSDYLLGLFE